MTSKLYNYLNTLHPFNKLLDEVNERYCGKTTCKARLLEILHYLNDTPVPACHTLQLVKSLPFFNTILLTKVIPFGWTPLPHDIKFLSQKGKDLYISF